MHLSSILSVVAKAVNTYVHVILFPFFIFNKLAKISNKLISHCHYGVLFLEFVEHN